ncbi:LysR family transcriptional regulator [Novosphingobium sp. PhB165]|uniref:LysR family transcriptional regulator n=1 Tax=Novosphingobium sp. PhB165 TaxID=2485105 RepID=UPI001404C8F6|nr:LysR family transcriptional regulator [Novosphingobium sp. PhB165]
MLDLRRLRYLVTLARRGNYARAADDLCLSQPALTRSVQSLERQLGMRLFDRDRSGVSLTPQGQVFVDGAAVLLENAEELERQAGLTAMGKQGRVGFGMAPMPARALLKDALHGQLHSAPHLTNDVVVRNVEALWPLLVAGEIEFFVSAEGQVPDAPAVRAEVLGSFPISFIVRKGHPLLATNSSGTFPTLVSSRAGSSIPEDLRQYADGPPHVVEDFETLLAVTSTSDAIWQSSTYAMAEEIKSGLLEELPRDHDAQPREARIVMYALGRRSQSPAALALKQAFRQRIRHLSEMRHVSRMPSSRPDE